jgi:hypothetical protein
MVFSFLFKNHASNKKIYMFCRDNIYILVKKNENSSNEVYFFFII